MAETDLRPAPPSDDRTTLMATKGVDPPASWSRDPWTRRPSRRHWPLRVSLSLVVVLIVAAVAYDVITVQTVHRAQASLRSAEQAAWSTGREVGAARARSTAISTLLAARQQAEARTVGEIGSTQQNITSTTRTLQLQSLDIATLRTCLAGVSTAESDVAGKDLSGAVASITTVSSACRSLDGAGTGLSYAFDFPDPFVLPVGSEYYAFATNSVAGNVQIIRSSDLSTWTTVGDALPHLAGWAQPGATWGPSVLQRGNSFVLYYSAVFASTGAQCISEAVATQPEGPYLDTSTAPLACQLDLGGSIDPSPVVGADGQPYLTWKSEGANGQPPRLWSQQLTPDGTRLVGGTASALVTPNQGWQGGTIEGPDMVVANGRYYLFYSANNWKTANYAIGVADCSGPLGPCAQPVGPPLLGSQQGLSGPGGPSVFADSSGRLHLAFHAWLPGKTGYPYSRQLYIWNLSFSNEEPQISP